MIEIVDLILSFCFFVVGSSALIAWFIYLDISDYKKTMNGYYQKSLENEKNRLKFKQEKLIAKKQAKTAKIKAFRSSVDNTPKFS